MNSQASVFSAFRVLHVLEPSTTLTILGTSDVVHWLEGEKICGSLVAGVVLRSGVLGAPPGWALPACGCALCQCGPHTTALLSARRPAGRPHPLLRDSDWTAARVAAPRQVLQGPSCSSSPLPIESHLHAFARVRVCGGDAWWGGGPGTSADPHSPPVLAAGHARCADASEGGLARFSGAAWLLQSGDSQPPNGCTAFEGSRCVQHSVGLRECGSVEDASYK